MELTELEVILLVFGSWAVLVIWLVALCTTAALAERRDTQAEREELHARDLRPLRERRHREGGVR